MKLNICQNNDIFIVGRTETDSNWCLSVQDIPQPATIFFQLSGIPEDFETIKKISWNFGDSDKCVTITNRKVSPETVFTKHIFKNISLETLTIQASVYTPPNVFIATLGIGPFIEKRKKNYIDPEFFKNQIVHFYNTKDLTDGLAIAINQIATRLAFAPNFINYTYREEMVGDAVIKMVKALREEKFNPMRGNPFSYFTKIAYHAFCNRIKKEKKMKETLTEYQDDVFSMLSESGYIAQRSSHTGEGTEDIEVEYNR
jgi:hypothetical protein